MVKVPKLSKAERSFLVFNMFIPLGKIVSIVSENVLSCFGMFLKIYPINFHCCGPLLIKHYSNYNSASHIIPSAGRECTWYDNADISHVTANVSV